MKAIFAQREAPKTFEEHQVFDSLGNLRLDVFNRAWTHINLKSTPGFPYFDCNTNREVDLLELYEDVNRTLRLWIEEPLYEDLDYLDPATRLKYFWSGHTHLAKVFIKGEPTPLSKVARNIYGASLIMNMISRILFGDYINSVKESWGVASHKVGIDFYSPAGLGKFTQFFDKLRHRKPGHCDIVSDDIQGWEYQGRSWMHIAWHKAYMDRAKATEFHRKLQTCYMMAELLTMILDSDGIIHSLPFFIVLSGKSTTHLQNSDERASLARVDSGLSVHLLEIASNINLWMQSDNSVTHSTNGDDCFGIFPKGCKFEFSTGLGFVHTDVQTHTPLEVNFCSQIFFRNTVHEDFKRKPDGLAKLLYNMLAADSKDASVDVLLQFEHHEARAMVQGLALEAWEKFRVQEAA